jgi:hypothetical protein
MQDTYGSNLNCTANDVQIANATNIEILDDGCAFAGDMVTFRADFEVVLTAQARHDTGIWFGLDGDPNGDGALTGTCSASTPAYAPDPPWLDLDGTKDPFPGGHKASNVQDECGDIDADHNPLYPNIELTVLCVAGEGNKLKLPYCTSWRQPGANELCTSPTEAIPGSPSKCKCDTGFTVDIDVPVPTLEVTKSATPDNVDEPGGNVRYDVTVANDVVDPSNRVTLTQMIDDVYGDITAVHGDITDTTCSLVTICPSSAGAGCTAPDLPSPYACYFKANVTGNGGDDVPDTVLVYGTDNNGKDINGSDDASVHINDLLPAITVTKSASPDQLPEPGGAVSFSVLVVNNSVADPVTIDSLVDDVHGDLDGQGDCSAPQVLAVGGSYSCSFTASVSGNFGYTEVDTVTASGADDEGNPVSGDDTATVDITNTPSMITLVKEVTPASVNEPGGIVSYTFLVTNNSVVDTVTINVLSDDKLGDLNGQGDCAVPQVLAPGASYGPCTVSGVAVTGDPQTPHNNIATASGVDDDGLPVMDTDPATVNFDNVAPAATLTKEVESADVTYNIQVCNDSTAEMLELTALVDDIYGDLDGQGSCAVPQTLDKKGEANECYSCSFIATATDDTTDTVTGTVEDDDGSAPAEPSDSATVTFD